MKPIASLIPVFLLLASCGNAFGQIPLTTTPTPDEIKVAVETVRDVYETYYKSAEDDDDAKRILAEKLVNQAAKRKSAALVFACFDEARRLYAEVGNVNAARDCIRQMATDPRLKPLSRSLLRPTLMTLAEAELDQDNARLLTNAARTESLIALDREEYAVAVEMINVAAQGAKQAEALDVALELRKFHKTIEGLARAANAVKNSPKDTAANTTLGEYWVFERGNWDVGLKYLAHSSTEAIAAAAKLDLEQPKTAKERTAIGEAWHDLVKSTEDAHRKTLLYQRAWKWYSAAVAVAKGDDDLKPSVRAKEIEEAFPDLFNAVFKGHTDAVAAVALSQDGEVLVTGSNDKTIRLWDTTRKQQLHVIDGHAGWVGSIVVTPDGKQFIASGGDPAIRIWDLKTRQQVAVLEGHKVAVRGLALTADGKLLLSGGNDGTCRLWNLSTGDQVRTFGDGKVAIESVAVTPDGSRVLAGTAQGVVNVYDANTGGVISAFGKHEKAVVYTIAVTPDGKTAVSAGGDKLIHVWDIATGKELRTLTGHTAQVYQVVLSADGKRLLSASYDKTVRLWDFTSGKELAVFEGHTDGVQGVCFGIGERTVYSASWDTTVRKWRAPQE